MHANFKLVKILAKDIFSPSKYVNLPPKMSALLYGQIYKYNVE